MHKLLVNNQLDAQLFKYVYFYSLHVSRSHVPTIRRMIVSMRHLVYVSLCRWPSGMQEHMLLHTMQARFQTRTSILRLHLNYLSYRNADKSLARPGRKQANVSVRMTWISFGALPRRKKLDHSSRLDVVEIARVPDMLPSLFPSWSD